MWFTATFIAPLPRPLRKLCADLMADSAFVFAKQSRLTVETNLRRIVPDAPDRKIDKMVKEAFRYLSYNYDDLTRVPYRTAEDIRSSVDFQKLEHFETASRLGKGVVIASAHLGNLDMVTQAFPALGVPSTMILAEQIQPQRLYDLTMRLRHAQSLVFEPATARGVKNAFKALRRGEWVGVAVDRAIQGNGKVVQFLGEPALMPVGAAELALRTGATLVPSYSLRTGFEEHKVCIEKPIEVERQRPTEETVGALTRQLLDIVESYVLKYPTQWTAVFESVWEADKLDQRLRRGRKREQPGASGAPDKLRVRKPLPGEPSAINESSGQDAALDCDPPVKA